MRVSGAPFWNDRSRAYYTQLNNPTEHLLRCLLPEGKSHLETCGPTASINCQAAMGKNLELHTPGGFSPQPEEVLSDWFNDPRNYSAMTEAWSGLDPRNLPGNEVAQWYPTAVRQVFGNSCAFVGNLSVDDAIAELRKGRTLQVCLRDPGHFVAIVAYDEEEERFIITDSWNTRWPDSNGFCRPFSQKEYVENLKPKTLIYS